MAALTFQSRVCQNQQCRLRYPLIQGSEYGERCPICLGETSVVAISDAQRELAGTKAGTRTKGPQALLDNIRSAWNVGSVFRSADGFGFSHLFLCGITPTPENEQVRKTALGSQDSVAWSAHRNAVELIGTLKTRGQRMWALENTPRSESLESLIARPMAVDNIVLAVGNEQAGIDPGILELADRVVHIEMRGSKRSLNVGVAFAVAAHWITREQG